MRRGRRGRISAACSRSKQTGRAGPFAVLLRIPDGLALLEIKKWAAVIHETVRAELSRIQRVSSMVRSETIELLSRIQRVSSMVRSETIEQIQIAWNKINRIVLCDPWE